MTPLDPVNVMFTAVAVVLGLFLAFVVVVLASAAVVGAVSAIDHLRRKRLALRRRKR